MIILYTKARCANTTKTKKWLSDNGIDFKVILLSSDTRLAKSFRESGCTETPIVCSATDAWQGHDLEKLTKLK